MSRSTLFVQFIRFARARRTGILSLALLAALLLLAVPSALAHTKLSTAMPAPDAVLESAPMGIRLEFTGKLEDSLHTIKLFQENGEQLAIASDPVVGEGNKVVSVPLPELAGGTYTVSYSVLSADGHPMEGSYKFTLNLPKPEPAEPPGQAEPDPVPAEPAPGEGAVHEHPAVGGNAAEHEGHAGNEGHEGHESTPATPDASSSWELPAGSMYVANVLSYFAFLPLVGWALWSALYGWREEEHRKRLKIGYMLQGLHLAAFLLLAAVQWNDIRLDSESLVFLDFLRNTDLGRSWLFTSLLAMAGFPLLFRSHYVDGIWALLLIAAKTLRGHANLAEPVALARLADGIHLAAASLWVGGLLTLLLALRGNRELFRGFMPRFSAVALGSVVALVFTGAALTLKIADSVTLIFYTDWGRFLMAKLALVIIVIPVAFLLRRKFRVENDAGFRGWLRVDALLLAGIITLTGLLTHVSPMPDREPLHWHVMGETIHMTAELSPNLKGRNELAVLVWTPEGEGAPAAVTAAIRDTQGEEASIALAPQEADEDAVAFPGFVRYDFEGNIRLEQSDEETLIIVVETAAGETITYEKTLSE